MIFGVRIDEVRRFSNEEQPENAEAPISVTQSGITTFLRAVQFKNALAPTFTALSNDTDASAVAEKAKSPTETAFERKSAFSKEEQSQKAYSDTVSNELPPITSLRRAHERKELLPTDLMLSGNTTVSRPDVLAKAKAPIFSMPSALTPVFSHVLPPLVEISQIYNKRG